MGHIWPWYDPHTTPIWVIWVIWGSYEMGHMAMFFFRGGNFWKMGHFSRYFLIFRNFSCSFFWSVIALRDLFKNDKIRHWAPNLWGSILWGLFVTFPQKVPLLGSWVLRLRGLSWNPQSYSWSVKALRDLFKTEGISSWVALLRKVQPGDFFAKCHFLAIFGDFCHFRSFLAKTKKKNEF